MEESLESFNPENVGEDSREPIYNYEWVDEVMQALNVSSDISNAFQVSRSVDDFKFISDKVICNY